LVFLRNLEVLGSPGVLLRDVEGLVLVDNDGDGDTGQMEPVNVYFTHFPSIGPEEVP